MSIFISMSKKELSRLELVQLVCQKRLTVKAAALQAGISRQRMSFLVNAYRKDGHAALVSSRRGKPSNNRISDDIRDRSVALIKEHYSDFGPTLATEYLFERHQINVSRETLRKWMVEAGIWTTRSARRKPIQQRRQRRECRGELVQLDGSYHDWFEGRGPECCLLVYIDDATGELLHLEFVKSESTFALMRATQRYLKKHGRPLALYTDKAGVYRNTGRSRSKGVSVTKTDSNLNTQYSRALDELGIAIICANTAQAKGRVERANGVLQDRLIKAMRLDGISSMDDANLYAETYIRTHNAKFARIPANPKELHRSLDVQHNLRETLCVKEIRKVSQSLDLRYDGHLIILDQAKHSDGFDPYSLIHARVDIHDYSDGDFKVRYQGRDIPHRIYNKSARVTQSDIVSSKRLGDVLAFIKDEQDSGEKKSYTPRRQRADQGNSKFETQN